MAGNENVSHCPHPARESYLAEIVSLLLIVSALGQVILRVMLLAI
jgi:hypothetical protein